MKAIKEAFIINSIEVVVTNDIFPTFCFELEKDIKAGLFLRIKASGVTMLTKCKLIGAKVQGQMENISIIDVFSFDILKKQWTETIIKSSIGVLYIDKELKKGSIVEIQCSFTHAKHQQENGPLQNSNISSGLSWYMQLGLVDSVEDIMFEQVSETLKIDFVAGSAEYLEAYRRFNGSLSVQFFDKNKNPTTLDTPIIKTIEGFVKYEDKNIFIPTHNNFECIKVYDDIGRHAKSNPYPRTMAKTPLFFGEIHWHTDFSSDGERSMEDALISARDELHLDFAGPSDHMNLEGNYGDKSPKEQAVICDKFNSSGIFSTIPGAELSGRYGHANIYTRDFNTLFEISNKVKEEIAPLWNEKHYPLHEIASVCPQGRALLVPHHTNMDSFVTEGVVREDGRPFWCAMHFSIPPERSIVRLFEMVQSRGCFEAEETDPLWRIWSAGYGGSARTALSKGYRIGFIAGSDNHSGWPTRGSDGYCGLTVIQATELKREVLFDALYNRRCYATSGARIVADATLNGYNMGSEIMLDPGERIVIKVNIQATAFLEAIQIIHFGYVLHEFDIDQQSSKFIGEWEDTRPGRPMEDAYYYIRVRQQDGHCAWLSPFWIDLK